MACPILSIWSQPRLKRYFRRQKFLIDRNLNFSKFPCKPSGLDVIGFQYWTWGAYRINLHVSPQGIILQQLRATPRTAIWAERVQKPRCLNIIGHWQNWPRYSMLHIPFRPWTLDNLQAFYVLSHIEIAESTRCTDSRLYSSTWRLEKLENLSASISQIFVFCLQLKYSYKFTNRSRIKIDIQFDAVAWYYIQEWLFNFEGYRRDSKLCVFFVQ